MIKKIYEEAISKIEANRAREIEVAKQKATQEKIAPFNADIDASLRAAIQELTAQLNEKIKQIQDNFNSQKQSLIEAAEKKKKEHAETAIDIAVSVINQQADYAIANLKTYIGKQGE